MINIPVTLAKCHQPINSVRHFDRSCTAVQSHGIIQLYLFLLYDPLCVTVGIHANHDERRCRELNDNASTDAEHVAQLIAGNVPKRAGGAGLVLLPLR